MFIATCAACGPIYPDPQPQQQQQQPIGTTTSGPPGGGRDPWDDRAKPPPERASEPPPRPEPEPPPRNRGKLPTDMQDLLDSHNAMRAKHCAPPLAWSPKLAAYAQNWANAMRDRGCKFEHSRGNKFGENLAGGTSGTLDGRAVTAMWYDEVKIYSFKNGGFSMETGHFTQLVWRATTQVGCATSSCNGMDLWVCEYDPPGNVETMYRSNVLPTGCR